MAMISVTVVLSLLNIQTQGDAAYTPVILWVLGGIIVKQMAIQGIVETSGREIIFLGAFLACKKPRR